MSHIQNERFIEYKTEMVETAITNGDYETAQAIINDTKEAGFEKEAEAMKELVANSPVANYLHLSPIQKYDL